MAGVIVTGAAAGGVAAAALVAVEAVVNRIASAQ
jgi:hypothetical protein